MYTRVDSDAPVSPSKRDISNVVSAALVGIPRLLKAYDGRAALAVGALDLITTPDAELRRSGPEEYEPEDSKPGSQEEQSHNPTYRDLGQQRESSGVPIDARVGGQIAYVRNDLTGREVLVVHSARSFVLATAGLKLIEDVSLGSAAFSRTGRHLASPERDSIRLLPHDKKSGRAGNST